MRTASTLVAVSLALLTLAACRSLETCKTCELEGQACGQCAGNPSCEAAGGTCADCTRAAAASAQTAECEGCAALLAGQTGWCAECGKGYNEGREVYCTQFCQANPGGPPCASCVK